MCIPSFPFPFIFILSHPVSESHFVAMDEQHSRSQRKFGAAPYCTTTFLNDTHLICQMNHVDVEQASKSDVTTKAGTLAKSKAKISHVEGMKAIVAAFKDSETQLQHFCTDQSADGMADAEVHFRPHWDFRPCYDIWHKVKEFQSLWKSFCMRRSCPRGMCFISILSTPRLRLLSSIFSFSLIRSFRSQGTAILIRKRSSSCLQV